VETEGEDGVVDETEMTTPKPSAKPAARPGKAAPVEEPEDGSEDLADLATSADGGDQEAASRLADLAKEAGIEEDAVSSAESWASVVELMQGGGEEGSDDEAEEDDWKPEKGEVYPYKAPGKKKAVDCEVTAVFETRETVNLKNLTDDKVYKAVPWDKLER
jgi:hypothetical protein